MRRAASVRNHTNRRSQAVPPVRKSTTKGSNVVTPVPAVSPGQALVGGAPLPAPLRSYFEPRFGRDLSHVRLHQGPAAKAAAASIKASAFQLGDDIAFGPAAPPLASVAGHRLLAHELAHVVHAPRDATIRRTPEEPVDEIARKAAITEALAVVAAMDAAEAEREKEQSPAPTAPKPSLMSLTHDQMCGGRCFTNEQIYAEVDRSRAEDRANEAKATAERKRRRDIRVHGTKQQKWELNWDERYYEYKNVGAVTGERDAGIMTPAGVRVPSEPGKLLSPRPFYEREMAGFLAWQGFIHYAEIVEAGHDAAAREMALKTNGGFPIRDDRLNLAAYTKWSYKAKSAREAVEAAMILATGANAMRLALARPAASTFAANFARIAGEPATARGAAMTVEEVAFAGVRVARTGDELFASYDTIVNVGRVAGQGKAMHTAFEVGTIEAAEAAGAATARVGVSNVINPAWQAHLESLGYWKEMIQVGPGQWTNFWTKVFKL